MGAASTDSMPLVRFSEKELKVSGERKSRRLGFVPGRMVWTMLVTFTFVACKRRLTTDDGVPGASMESDAMTVAPARVVEPLR